MLSTFFKHQVTVQTPGVRTDQYGSVVFDWDNSTDVSEKVWIDAERGGEDTDLRQTDEGKVTMYFSPLAQVLAKDRIVFDGTTYEVTAPPKRRYDRSGLHHLEASCTDLSQ